MHALETKIAHLRIVASEPYGILSQALAADETACQLNSIAGSNPRQHLRID